MLAAATSGATLIELGIVLLGLGILGRIAVVIRVPTIPLYLGAGLVLGDGSLGVLDTSTDFIRVGADVGAAMLLLLLGLEFTPRELTGGLRRDWPSGLADLVMNFAPGLVCGFALGWQPMAAVLLGGVTYVTSSGIVAKLLDELGRLGNRETPTVLSILVIEDLAMAVYLPIAGALLVGGGVLRGVVSVVVALGAVSVALFVAYRFGDIVSRALITRSREILLLTMLGLTLLIAGLAEEVRVSAAVGALLVGVMISGRAAELGREVLGPMRDVFGAFFFVFFGLQIDPSDLLDSLVPAALLAAASTLCKAATGWWAARRAGIGIRGRRRAAVSLIPHGEFSILVAGLGVAAGTESALGSLAAAYVLLTATVGAIGMRVVEAIPVPAARGTTAPRNR
ncbi:MAG: hypothetical protein RL219_709 [Actinomycetota bacterium]